MARKAARPSGARMLLAGPPGIVLKALALAVVMVGVKALVHRAGWEVIETLPLLTALMGGVVFTLAIILSGVMADFKESERIVGELATHLQRLRADAALIAEGDRLRELRGHAHALCRALLLELRQGDAVRMREVRGHVAALDGAVAAAAAAKAASSQLRTVQVHLAGIVRIANRLETIIETTFMKAGYYYAGFVVAVAVAALTLTQLRPFEQGVFLYGFAVFLLAGLFLLVADLDNPFSGHVTIALQQLDKVERELAEGLAPEGDAPASAVVRIA